MQSLVHIWITEETFGIDVPRCEQYTASTIRRNADRIVSATVLIRGHTRVIRAAAGRKFWDDETACREYVQRVIRSQIARHQRAIPDLTSQLDTFQPYIVPAQIRPLPERPIEL